MSEMKLTFKTPDEIVEFVKTVSKYEFDVDVTAVLQAGKGNEYGENIVNIGKVCDANGKYRSLSIRTPGRIMCAG